MTAILRSDPILIMALASGASVAAAARAAGVGHKTVNNRIADAGFRRLVDEARQGFIDEATGKLAAASTAAADTLLALLAPEHPGMVWLGASRALLEMGSRFGAEAALARRLEALEQALDG